MWYLKFKVKHKDCIFSPLAKKYNLHIEFFPLNHYIEKDFLFTPSLHIVKGEEKNVKSYLKELKSNSRVLELEVSKVIFTLTKEKTDKASYKAVYNPKILYITPGFNSPDGFEIWEVASWDRKLLENLIKVLGESKNIEVFEILRFEEKKIDDVYIARLFPELPKKQKQAIELAYKEGYYKFPKSTNLDKLAKKVKISKQTFQENLKKAEAKLMPLILR
jgi:predicted DNA binding protein